MKKKSIYLLLFTVLFSMQNLNASTKKSVVQNERWTTEKATAWYASQPWLSGCNFQPSSAINQIEMWQSESFDAPTIDKELGWAEELGLTPCVFI